MQRLNILIFFFISFIFSACGNNSKDSAIIDEKPRNDVENLQKAVAQYPDSVVLVQDLIQSYRNHGNYDSAINLTLRQTNRDTSNAYLWNVLATLYYEKGDTMHTIDALQRAISIYPVPEYYVALGTVYAETKNPNAIAIADYLLEGLSTKNHDDAYFIKGLYYNFTGNPQKAVKVLDSCLSLNYTYMYAYREKGIALYDLKKYTGALGVLKRAVILQNNFDEGYYWMGRTYEKLKLKDSAIAAYQNALLYDKNYVEAQQALDNLTLNNQSN